MFFIVNNGAETAVAHDKVAAKVSNFLIQKHFPVIHQYCGWTLNCCIVVLQSVEAKDVIHDLLLKNHHHVVFYSIEQ